MPRVTTASRDQIEAIYRESHALWGTGLSLSDYVGLWDELAATAWARRNARFLVSVDASGRVLSSLKHYRPDIRLFGRPARATVIGAVFTPRAERGRGHGSSLVREVLATARESGDQVAMLFSDIGTIYYESLGFRALPAIDHWGALPRGGRALVGDWTLRPMRDGDSENVRLAHHRTNAHRTLAIDRDEEHWRFLSVRSESYFRRATDREIRPRALVAMHDGRFAGFLNTVESREEWSVREVGVPDGEPSALADLLTLGASAARRGGLRRFYAWLPPEAVGRLRGWKIRGGPRKRAVPMIAALDETLDLGPLFRDRTLYIPYQDQF